MLIVPGNCPWNLFRLCDGESTLSLGMRSDTLCGGLEKICSLCTYCVIILILINAHSNHYPCAGDDPEDKLASPSSLQNISREDANIILDEEDGMESTEEFGDCADDPTYGQDRAAHKRLGTDNSVDECVSVPGPSLPLIYYSIL
jgi:hypothetical protein